MDWKTVKVHDLVKPATNHDALSIGAAWWKPVTVNTIFRVQVIVLKARGWQYFSQGHPGEGKTEAGFIVQMDSEDRATYPYIWDFRRFIKVER